MLLYSGKAAIKEYDFHSDFNIDIDFKIRTLLGAVKFIFNKGEPDANGLYIFGKKIKKKANAEDGESDDNKESNITDTKNCADQSVVKDRDTEKSSKLKDTVKKIKSLLSLKYHNKELLLKKIFGLIKYLLPEDISGHLKYGLNDPSDTGKVLGILAILYPITEGNFKVTPEWNKAIIDTDVNFNHRMHITVILFKCILIWFNRDFQMIWRNRNVRTDE